MAGGLATTYDGFPSYEWVKAMCAQFIEELGVSFINIADTVGMADPLRCTSTYPAHGMANLLAGLEVGVV